MIGKIDRALYRATEKIVREPSTTIPAICARCRLDGCGHNVLRAGPWAICRCLTCPKVTVGLVVR